jgi:hypothetical protein
METLGELLKGIKLFFFFLTDEETKAQRNRMAYITGH